MSNALPGVDAAPRSRALSQWYTPASLAERVAKWAVANGSHEWVLEPSAGRGALIKALNSVCGCNVFAWDIDCENVTELHRLYDQLERVALNVTHGDFLASVPELEVEFDLALMNPPYEGGQDVRFIDHALECCDRVVGIFQSRIVHSQGRADFWRRHDIQRLVVLSERPHFGGVHSAKTDFIVAEIVRRQHRRKQGEPNSARMEWW